MNTPSLTLPEADAQSELTEYLYTNQQRRSLLPRAALVGLLSGLVVAAFRYLLSMADEARNALIAWSHGYPAVGWLLMLGMGSLGALVAVGLVVRYAPEASGSGIPHLEAVLHRYRNMDWRRLLPVKFIGGLFGIGVGMALGREGPSVQLGGAVADATSSLMKTSAKDRLTLIAAGAGAGLAAAFNTPLAGVVFVLEELQRDFRPIVFGAAFVASIVSNLVARLLLGQAHMFIVPTYATPPLSALPLFVLLGVATGLLGVFFNKALVITQALYARLNARIGTPLVAAALTGAVVGIAAWIEPLSAGGGHALAEGVLQAHIFLAAIPLWFAVRFALTMCAYATGAPGGIFAPLLILGALIGLAIGLVAHQLAPQLAPEPGAFAVVGMAAYFTAIVRAPLTGIVLITEMTSNYEQMLSLSVACFTAYIIAEALRDMPIYEILLEHDLQRGGIHPQESALPLVVEVEVEALSSFAGKQVRDLGLPVGCLLVRCEIEGQEFVPTAATRLPPHTRLTATIAPGAEHALLALRRGCESKDD